MTTDGRKWHYPAVKSLSALPRCATSKHDGDWKISLKSIIMYVKIMIIIM